MSAGDDSGAAGAGVDRLPVALVLAGPNGAGKTTASRRLVLRDAVFLNADVIVARLVAEGHQAAGVDIVAGRILLAQLRQVVESGGSFCLETNLAGRGLIRSISTWREAGYAIGLAFVALDSPELALARVKARVAAGGHHVPEPVVRRRWKAGLRALFDVYLPLVDDWWVFDNSGNQATLVAQGIRSAGTEIIDPIRWEDLQRLASRAS